jgi:hypothetical protein
VRGFGQIIAHVAAEQYLFCGPVSGEKKPPVDEKSLLEAEQGRSAESSC